MHNQCNKRLPKHDLTMHYPHHPTDLPISRYGYDLVRLRPTVDRVDRVALHRDREDCHQDIR